MKTKFWIGLLFGILWKSNALFAQVSFEQSIDSSFMLIGSQQKLHLRCADEKFAMRIFDQLDTLSWMEVLDTGTWNRTGGWINRDVLFTVFDSGVYRIPPLGIALESDSMKSLGNPLFLEVGFPKDSLTDLRPIKYIIESKDNSSFILRIALFSFLILAMLFILWQFFKADRSKPPHIRLSEQKTPSQIALDALAGLQKEQLPEQGKWKPYSDQLTFILRNFISDGLLISALEKTSTELIEEVDRNSANVKHTEYLAEFLRTSDLVKFANVVPAMDNAERWFQYVQKFIEKNSQLSEQLLESGRKHFLRLLGPELAAQFEDPEQTVPMELLQLYREGNLAELELHYQLIRQKSFKLPQPYIDYHLAHTGSFYRWQRIILSIHPNAGIRLALFLFVLPFVTLFMPVLLIVAKWNNESLMGRGIFGLSANNRLILRNSKAL